jgi:hypothetical protein
MMCAGWHAMHHARRAQRKRESRALCRPLACALQELNTTLCGITPPQLELLRVHLAAGVTAYAAGCGSVWDPWCKVVAAPPEHRVCRFNPEVSASMVVASRRLEPCEWRAQRGAAGRRQGVARAAVASLPGTETCAGNHQNFPTLVVLHIRPNRMQA